MTELFIEEVGLLNFVAIGCVTGKGKYGRSDSLPVWTVEANKALGNELEYDGCNLCHMKMKIRTVDCQWYKYAATPAW